MCGGRGFLGAGGRPAAWHVRVANRGMDTALITAAAGQRPRDGCCGSTSGTAWAWLQADGRGDTCLILLLHMALPIAFNGL